MGIERRVLSWGCCLVSPKDGLQIQARDPKPLGIGCGPLSRASLSPRCPGMLFSRVLLPQPQPCMSRQGGKATCLRQPGRVVALFRCCPRVAAAWGPASNALTPVTWLLCKAG